MLYIRPPDDTNCIHPRDVTAQSRDDWPDQVNRRGNPRHTHSPDATTQCLQKLDEQRDDRRRTTYSGRIQSNYKKPEHNKTRRTCTSTSKQDVARLNYIR